MLCSSIEIVGLFDGNDFDMLEFFYVWFGRVFYDDWFGLRWLCVFWSEWWYIRGDFDGYWKWVFILCGGCLRVWVGKYFDLCC